MSLIVSITPLIALSPLPSIRSIITRAFSCQFSLVSLIENGPSAPHWVLDLDVSENVFQLFVERS